MVIIKGTMSYQGQGLKDYTDLEIVQMMGRAGRPQFDDSAVAVIITKEEKAQRYEKLVSGSQLLESCLHLNLIEHLNAEVGLGTIYDLQSAKRWLSGTFLHVRMRKTPEHYNLDGETAQNGLESRVEKICQKDIQILQNAGLVKSTDKLISTELGEIMARYCVNFTTMQTFLDLGLHPKISDIVSLSCSHPRHCTEGRSFRLWFSPKNLQKYDSNQMRRDCSER